MHVSGGDYNTFSSYCSAFSAIVHYILPLHLSAPTKQTVVLPQIAQNSQKLLLGMTSHRLHRSTQMVWVRKILPQISQNSQNLLLGMTSHRFHRFAQMVRLRRFSHRLHRCNFRGCTCLKCTNQANSDPPTDCTDLHRWFGCERSSHRLHRSTQMVRLRKIVAEVSLPPQQQSAYHRLHRSTQMLLILGWCTSSRLVHLRQVHPREGTLTICADL